MAYRKVKGPAMTDWPSLFIDQQNNKAKVKARVVNWKADLRGYSAANWLAVLCLFFEVGGILWASDNMPVRKLWYAFAVALIPQLCFFQYVVYPQLAHWLGKTITVTFCPECVWIGWKKIPRTFQGTPLDISFTYTTDSDAQKKLALNTKLNRREQYTIQQARKVMMVIVPSAMGKQPIGPGKVYAIAELPGDEQAIKFSSACNNAAKQTGMETQKGFDQQPVECNLV